MAYVQLRKLVVAHIEAVVTLFSQRVIQRSKLLLTAFKIYTHKDVRVFLVSKTVIEFSDSFTAKDFTKLLESTLTLGDLYCKNSFFLLT